MKTILLITTLGVLASTSTSFAGKRRPPPKKPVAVQTDIVLVKDAEVKFNFGDDYVIKARATETPTVDAETFEAKPITESVAAKVVRERADQLELPAEAVFIAAQDGEALEIGDGRDDAVRAPRPRVAVVVHDLEEVEVVRLDVPHMSLDRPRACELVRREVMPEREWRPVGLASVEDRLDAFDLVHFVGFGT